MEQGPEVEGDGAVMMRAEPVARWLLSFRRPAVLYVHQLTSRGQRPRRRGTAVQGEQSSEGEIPRADSV
jgi:hypothetical protein